MRVYNTDGILKDAEAITEFVQIQLIVNNYKELINLVITNLGKTVLYLEYNWLKHYNPIIDWQDKIIHLDGCPEECTAYRLYTLSLKPGDCLFMINVEHYLCKIQTDNLPLHYIASPNWVYEFSNVFSEKDFKQLSSHHL